jgi:hypothetical protein
MKHVAAFRPRLETTGISAQDWERLPWLCDVPTRVRKPRHGRLLIVVLAVSVDAIASYAAGRTAMEPARHIQVRTASAEEMRAFAQRMASAAPMSWYRPRPAAPY